MTQDLGRRVTATAELGCALTREAGASILTAQLYPFGLVGGGLPLVPRPWATPSRGSVPILFIHGIFHNPTAFAWLKQKLAWAGWRKFDEINLFTSIRSIPNNAQRVARRVAKLCDQYGVPQVDLVAHSMGGIIARYYVQLLGGDRIVRNLITLGTPHRGTQWSRYSLLPHLRELSPESRTLAILNSCPSPRYTQAIAVCGDLDIFMRPRGAHCWSGVKNVELKGVGHAGVLFSKRVASILYHQLGENSRAL